MQKTKKLATALLALIMLVVAVGCQSQAPEDEQQILKVLDGQFLQAAERQPIIPFQGTDLYTDAEVSFGTDAEGRVRMLSFFSLG